MEGLAGERRAAWGEGGGAAWHPHLQANAGAQTLLPAPFPDTRTRAQTTMLCALRS